MRLKSVLKQLIEARNRQLIVFAEAWPSSDCTFTTVTIKFYDTTTPSQITRLEEHFKTRYDCTHTQRYNIGTTQFLTFVFPEVMPSAVEVEA